LTFSSSQRGFYRQKLSNRVTRFTPLASCGKRAAELEDGISVYPSRGNRPLTPFESCPSCRARWKALTKGRGQDLYGACAITSPTDSGAATFNWTTSARSGQLIVRSLLREDDCRNLLFSNSSSVREESSSLKTGSI